MTDEQREKVVRDADRERKLLRRRTALRRKLESMRQEGEAAYAELHMVNKELERLQHEREGQVMRGDR